MSFVFLKQENVALVDTPSKTDGRPPLFNGTKCGGPASPPSTFVGKGHQHMVFIQQQLSLEGI